MWKMYLYEIYLNFTITRTLCIYRPIFCGHQGAAISMSGIKMLLKKFSEFANKCQLLCVLAETTKTTTHAYVM